MGELCSISSGESDTKDAVPSGPYAFFDRSRVIKRSVRFLYDCEALIIPGEGKEFLPRHYTGKFDLHQRAYALFEFRPDVDVRFLYHLLHYRVDYFPSVAVGATVKSLRRRHFEQFPVPLPPLPEQRRIVAVLDAAFEGIATAAANTERNLQNARDLFESHLAEVFSRRGEGWVETTLGEIADFKNGLNYTRSSRGQTIPFVGVGDFKSNLVVPVADLESVTIDGSLPSDYALEEGDILLVRSNGSRDLVGRSMLVPPLESATSFSGFLIRVRGKRSAVESEFLLYLLRCRDTRAQLQRGGGGASISNINQKVLSALSLHLPPQLEQRELVRQLDTLSAETDRLIRLYEQKQAALAALKRSLLHQAFAGEL
jgi:type I restriction enzyme S subunit